MSEQYLHTPEGVRDIYGDECSKKLAIESKIRRVFHSYGYEDIETPVFEFFDIFRKERGSVDTREMYKFFDRENNTLVLRPDLTPSIARCVARYYREVKDPIRLCYCGPTFLNSARYQGHSHESTQTGVELIGDGSVDADAEMLALVIDALRACGLEEFQIEVGDVDFFKGLLEEARLSKEEGETLRGLIERKNFFGVEELLSKTCLEENLGELFMKLPELFGDISRISALAAMTDNPRALAAIERLESLQQILDDYGLGEYVSYDLGMLGNYGYYTGLIFKAYTYGSGDYLVTGGRYDDLLTQFGKDAPAIGFAIVTESLLSSLTRQNTEIPTEGTKALIVYREPFRKAAISLGRELRSEGVSLILRKTDESTEPEDILRYATDKAIPILITFDESDGKAYIYETASGSYLPFDKERRLSK